MDADKTLSLFCEYKGVSRDLLLKGGDVSLSRQNTRYMAYTVLRQMCGLSSYKISTLFSRSRRNVVRGISIFKTNMTLYPEMRKDYLSVTKYIEGAIKSNRASQE